MTALCKHGHKLTPANTLLQGKTAQCRECLRIQGKAIGIMMNLGLKSRPKPEYTPPKVYRARRFVSKPPSAVELAVLAPTLRRDRRGQQADTTNLEAAIAARVLVYRQDALEALQDLAMMPLSENSSQNQVKYMAATRLLGGDKAQDAPPAPIAGPTGDVMAQLRDAYRATAPRIREVRERIITFDEAPPGA